jgi:hypothetical protein
MVYGRNSAQLVFLVFVGLWLGMMATVGILVPLTVFSYLSDKQVAGMVAGQIFKNAGYLNLLFGIIFLVFANIFVRRGISYFRLNRWLLLGTIVLTMLGSFVIQPWMVNLRENMLALGMPVMQSHQAELFRVLHGASSSIYSLEVVLLILVLYRTFSGLSRE